MSLPSQNRIFQRFYEKFFILNFILVEEESNLRQLRSLCPCADQALEQMAVEMYTYQDRQRTNPGETSVDSLVKSIKDIAYGTIADIVVILTPLSL